MGPWRRAGGGEWLGGWGGELVLGGAVGGSGVGVGRVGRGLFDSFQAKMANVFVFCTTIDTKTLQMGEVFGGGVLFSHPISILTVNYSS